ncbi:MAG: ComEC/Rec2 family competence protein, partial [Clostridia bacterium]|nr:ComEC/Rec2 family competence protein [Clostridia bacterium]
MSNYTKDNNQIMNFRPLVTVAICFIVGIILPIVYLCANATIYFVLAVISIAVIVVLAVIRSKKFNKLSYVVYGIGIAFLIFGSIVTFSRIFYNLGAETRSYEVVSGYVQKINSKEELSNGYKYGLIVNANVDGVNEKIYTVIVTNKEITVFNEVTFKGKLNNYYCKSSKGVNLYPLTDNIRYSVYEPIVYSVGGLKEGIIPTLRNHLYNTLKSYCPVNYGVINGILTGDTSGIDNYDLTTYRRLGVAHIFAVSGLHVGFLFAAVVSILKLFKVKRTKHIYFVIPTLLFYVAFCGFTASCMRAFTIILIKLIADTFGYKRDGLNTISIGAIVVLTINPTSLFTIGFQLSFLAYMGIILFTKPFSRLLSKVLSVRASEFISPYVVAYLSTLPVIVDCFGYLAPFAILFNVLVIPIIGIVYVACFIVSILLMIS